MVLGLKQGYNAENPKENRDKVYALVQEFNKRFINVNGSANCTVLLGYDSQHPRRSSSRQRKEAF